MKAWLEATKVSNRMAAIASVRLSGRKKKSAQSRSTSHLIECIDHDVTPIVHIDGHLLALPPPPDKKECSTAAGAVLSTSWPDLTFACRNVLCAHRL